MLSSTPLVVWALAVYSAVGVGAVFYTAVGKYAALCTAFDVDDALCLACTVNADISTSYKYGRCSKDAALGTAAGMYTAPVTLLA